MAKIFLSFLGTSPYVECCYRMNGISSAPVRFVQEQTVLNCCKEWSENDRIVIFCTRAAKERNWEDNGHNDGKPGLARRLASLDLKVSIQRIEIPEGSNETQLWEIFAIVLDQIQDHDEVVFDITHAFRSIPMLAIIILNYAKIVRKIKLIGIYYGAFEALGTPKEVVEKWPNPEGRVAPVLDLTPLDQLLDWSFAVDKLLKAGDATAIRALARASVTNLLKESKGKDLAAVAIRRLGDALEQFTKTMSTCRCREIGPAVENLKTALCECNRTNLINPLKPLISDIEKSVAPFQEDMVRDGVHAAGWCAKHHLIQQGITILNETLITWCLQAVGETARISDVKLRRIASQALDIVKRERPETDWKGDAKDNPEFTHRLISVIKQGPGVEKAASVMRELRNDINHGGMGPDSKKADLFGKKLGELLTMVERMLTG
jgi:CRISPR-associated Csx2 family protein